MPDTHTQRRIRFQRQPRKSGWLFFYQNRLIIFSLVILFCLGLFTWQFYQMQRWPDFKPNPQLARRAENGTVDFSENPIDSAVITTLVNEIARADSISLPLLKEIVFQGAHLSADSNMAVLFSEKSSLTNQSQVVVWNRQQELTLWLPIRAASLPVLSPDGNQLAYLVPSRDPHIRPTEIQLFDLNAFENKVIFRSYGKSYSTGFIRLVSWPEPDLILFEGTAGALMETTKTFQGCISISNRDIGIIATETK